ncbi:MAG: flagellar protein FlgN [Tissierellales bacterium]|jgi:hypothetical protein|nr:flagellar protein FlgN [Tissierellales bacterium]
MRAILDQLRVILQEELEVYKKLLDITLTKKDVITENRIQELDKMTQVEQSLIMKIGKLEESREKLVDQMGKRIGLKDFGMRELIDHLEDKDKSFFVEIREDLLRTLNRIHDGNDLNKVLIEDSLEFVNLNLDLLTSVGQSDNYKQTAEDPGQVKPSKSLFDVKI